MLVAVGLGVGLVLISLQNKCLTHDNNGRDEELPPTAGTDDGRKDTGHLASTVNNKTLQHAIQNGSLVLHKASYYKELNDE